MNKLVFSLVTSTILTLGSLTATAADSSVVNAGAIDTKTGDIAVESTEGSFVRLVPHVGINGFSTSDNRTTKNIGRSYGMWVDIGNKDWTFETGLTLTNASAERRVGNSALITTTQDVAGAGIPLFVKYNILGRADSTVYIKTGATILPTLAGASTKNFPIHDVWATAALGGVIPVMKDTSIVLEGNYLKPIGPESTSIRQYGIEGFSFLAGASIGL